MVDRFKQRSDRTERLDRGEFTAAEYQRWHKELWYIHRFFGEIRALKKSLFHEIAIDRERPISVLDIAAGSGELLLYIKKNSPGKPIFAVGGEASSEAANSIRSKGLVSVQCDAVALPFAPNSFDFVVCTLFLHHLNASQATSFLSQIASVARVRFFVIDLDRRPLPYLAYRFFGRFLLQRFTRDDGALSILRSHRPKELAVIAERAGLTNITIKRSAINRLILSGSA